MKSLNLQQHFFLVGRELPVHLQSVETDQRSL